MDFLNEVRALYEQLDPLAQKAVQEATHDAKGFLHRDRFIARHGRMPSFHHSPPAEKLSYSYYDSHKRPTRLVLFFPQYDWLPTDTRQLLLTFVPSPPPFALRTQAEPPATIRLTWKTWEGRKQVEASEEVPLRLRETARDAQHDLRAVLRLVDLGRVRVTDKKRHPTTASVKAVAEVLRGGDFYTTSPQRKQEQIPCLRCGLVADCAWISLYTRSDGMEGELVLQTLFRWLHVGTAIVLLGGSVFMRFVLMPAAEKLSTEAHEMLRGHIMAVWRFFVHVGVLFLLGSGLYNYIAVMIPRHKGDGLYHALMGVKILLALAVFFLAEALVGRAAAFEKLRQKRKMWLGVIVLLAALVVAISGFLKVRGVPLALV